MELLEPGIYEDTPQEHYHALPYVSNSAIKAGIRGQSMLKMHHKIIGDFSDKDSEERKFGRNQHCYILEGPEKFYERTLISTKCCAIKKDGEPCGNGGKFYDGRLWYCGQHKGSCEEVPENSCSPEDVAKIQAIGESIRKSPCISTLKSNGWSELTLVWDMFGLRCKARLDRHSHSRKLTIDLKKFDSDDLTPDKCNREISSRWYHLQAAFYRMGMFALRGYKPQFMWIFTESSEPFEVIPVQATAGMLLHGEAWATYMLKQYAECKERGEYPGVWTLNKPVQAELMDWQKRNLPPEEFSNDGADDEASQYINAVDQLPAGGAGYESTDEDSEWLG